VRPLSRWIRISLNASRANAINTIRNKTTSLFCMLMVKRRGPRRTFLFPEDPARPLRSLSSLLKIAVSFLCPSVSRLAQRNSPVIE
jgi:hypothetical protein